MQIAATGTSGRVCLHKCFNQSRNASACTRCCALAPPDVDALFFADLPSTIYVVKIRNHRATCHFDDTNECRLPQQGRVDEFAYINASTKAATHRHVRGVAPLRGMLGMLAPTSCIRCGEQPHPCSPTAVWTSVDSTKRGSALRLRATDTARVVGNRW